MIDKDLTRVIERRPARAESCAMAPSPDDAALRAFLEEQASRHGLRWMLAHLDDGVLWGRWEATGLTTGHEAARETAGLQAYVPPLRALTLQQLRLFAPHAELLVWRDEDRALRARLLHDVESGATADWDECFDEAQILWGTYAHPLASGFSLLEHGEQGLRHAVPCVLSGEIEPPRLRVRHYLTRQGLARVDAGRLCELIG